MPHRVLYFDVPESLRSKIVLLTYTYQHYVPLPVIDATPADIVNAVQELKPLPVD